MLEVRDLYFRHKGKSLDSLKGISFTAEKGEVTVILGPNGSGKTTLFKCISGLWKYYRGEVKVENKVIDLLSFRKRARLFSVVPQEHEPPFPYSVFDVALMGRASYIGVLSSPGKKDYEKVSEALSIVGIEHLKDISYTKISGGERQLTLIARALVQEAPVMLLDEPTSHLDFKNQLFVLCKIKKIIIDRQITAVMTIHDPNLAMLFADSVVMVRDGSVIAKGKMVDVINEENIKKIYDIDVSILSFNGRRMIMPKMEVIHNV